MLHFLFIQQIYVLNILNMLQTLRFFPLQNAVYFIMLPFLVPVLFPFYIQVCSNLKKNSGAKALKKYKLTSLFYIGMCECIPQHVLFEYKHCRIVALLILPRPTVLLFVFVYKCARLLNFRCVRTLENIAY